MKGRRFIMNNLADPAVPPIDSIVIMAFAGIGPVGDKNAAVRPVLDTDASKPRIVGEQKILAVMRDVAGAFAFEDVVVDAIAMQVAHENGVAIAFGPIVGQVDHDADVGMAAAGVAMRPQPAQQTFP